MQKSKFLIIFYFFFNVTLHPTCSKVGRESLLLRHSASHFLPIFIGIVCGVVERALLRHQSEKNKILNMSFRRVGMDPTTFCSCSRLRSWPSATTGSYLCCILSYSDEACARPAMGLTQERNDEAGAENGKCFLYIFIITKVLINLSNLNMLILISGSKDQFCITMLCYFSSLKF